MTVENETNQTYDDSYDEEGALDYFIGLVVNGCKERKEYDMFKLVDDEIFKLEMFIADNETKGHQEDELVAIYSNLLGIKSRLKTPT